MAHFLSWQSILCGSYFLDINSFKTNDLMDGTKRKDIQVGSDVQVIQKHHQRTGELTDGTVKRILTKSSTHPHGIKVMLDDGIVGRVKKVIND